MSKIFGKYLEKNALFNNLIKEAPNTETKLIVIIPAYNEPDIINTLMSLKNCTKAKFPTEILIVINQSEITSTEISRINKETFTKVNNWTRNNATSILKFYVILIDNLPQKHAGAGLARKIAMDLAIERFQSIDEENGIIASLDADTLVSENYLSEIQKAFLQNKKLNAATFYFEHIPNDILEINIAVETYELYLRYFKQALHYTGFPYAYHTIGSCFAVRASAYAKQGGMNRRQGGEDFYFLHKVFPLDNCKELNHISVFPSSRPSDRVPFGTGPAIQKIINDGEYPTYRAEMFDHLKYLFDHKNELFQNNLEKLASFYSSLDQSIKHFIKQDEFADKLLEINANCASIESFEKRFFQWFDAFKIIKYLNFTHKNSGRISTQKAALGFLKDNLQIKPHTEKISDLLELYRSLEREN
ncbi:MAG: glycosyltransferase [Salinivirgaceae bacterium]|nr:glycosyltransferase [Salinivirgaceae bacterium]